MNVDAARAIDRWVGLPLCWALTACRYLAIPFVQGQDRPVRKVLIIKLSEMGSTVFACPALGELTQREPGVELFFLVFGENRAIVDALQLAPPENVISLFDTAMA